MKNKKYLFILITLLISTILVFNCTGNTGNTGNTGADYSSASDELLLEDEYFLGKASSGLVLDTYAPHSNNEVNEYMQFIGLTLAAKTGVPNDVYKTYSFQLLDTSENIAYTSPSGFIMVSKNMMTQCANEDEFAGVIAHLIALNANKAIVNNIPKELKQKLNYSFDKENQELMNETAGEIAGEILKYVENGYDKASFLEADADAVIMMAKVGYSVEAYKNMIKNLTPNGYSYAEAVPSIEERLTAVEDALADLEGTLPTDINEARTNRFNEMTALIK